jgi:peptidyl-prolyl cis-trans isomerase C
MDTNEHAKPDLETVRARLLARAGELGWLEGRGAGEVAFASREAEDELIERLLEQEVPAAEPTDEDCRRWYEQNPRRFTAGELVEASHILFAITPRVPPERLRAKAAEVHAKASRDPAGFAKLAGEYSNCPSAAQGGSLGQLGRGDSVPEFEKAVLEGELLGVLPDLVATRFGFHVVLVARRIPGRMLPFDEAREEVRAFLRQRATERALGEYVRSLTPPQPA